MRPQPDIGRNRERVLPALIELVRLLARQAAREALTSIPQDRPEDSDAAPRS